MSVIDHPFVPPAPVPRNRPPSRFEIIRTVMRNPLELLGERGVWFRAGKWNEKFQILQRIALLIANHWATALGPGFAVFDYNRDKTTDDDRGYLTAVARPILGRAADLRGETWRLVSGANQRMGA